MTQTALVPAVPTVALTLVTCASCGNIVPVSQAVRFEIIEAIDGDETNLTVSNIRFTGETGYDCDRCIDAYCATLDGGEAHV